MSTGPDARWYRDNLGMLTTPDSVKIEQGLACGFETGVTDPSSISGGFFVGKGPVIINELGYSGDITVESDHDQYILAIDAGNDAMAVSIAPRNAYMLSGRFNINLPTRFVTSQKLEFRDANTRVWSPSAYHLNAVVESGISISSTVRINRDLPFDLYGSTDSAAEAPGITFRETGSNSYWLLAKRGSAYAVQAQPDWFFLSYYDGAVWHQLFNFDGANDKFYPNHMAPQAANNWDLGDATHEWRDFYMAGTQYFGLTQDVNLFRGAADLLETSDTFKAGGYQASDGSAGIDTTLNVCDCSGNVVVVTVKDGLVTAAA